MWVWESQWRTIREPSGVYDVFGVRSGNIPNRPKHGDHTIATLYRSTQSSKTTRIYRSNEKDCACWKMNVNENEIGAGAGEGRKNTEHRYTYIFFFRIKVKAISNRKCIFVDWTKCERNGDKWKDVEKAARKGKKKRRHGRRRYADTTSMCW